MDQENKMHTLTEFKTGCKVVFALWEWFGGVGTEYKRIGNAGGSNTHTE